MRARLEGPWLGTQRLGALPAEDVRMFLETAAAAGVRWFDTAPIYGSVDGAVERLLADFLAAHPDVSVATKGGLVRQGRSFRPDGRAKVIEEGARTSLDRLGRIDLFQLHAPDPRVPFATTLRSLVRLVEQGTVRAVGLCNCTVSQLEQAAALFPVSSVQVEISPVAATAVRSGVVEVALGLRIPVLAWRPLGGADRVGRVLAHPTIAQVAARREATPARIVLAWLASFGVVPIPGPTRPETVRDDLGFGSVHLDGEDLGVLDAAFQVGRLRIPRWKRKPLPSDREVMLVMGSPESGKSTYAAQVQAAGALRLNRDIRGGTVDGLLAPLDRALAGGAQRVVLDNTYPTRAARSGVIEIAWKHGIAVRCVWMTTPDGTCEVNAVRRILDVWGRLPEPEELDRPRGPPALLGPRALHRYREQLERPREDEGFVTVEPLPWVGRPDSALKAAVLFDPTTLITAAGVLREMQAEGQLLLCIGWAPAAPAGEEELIRERARARDLVLDGVALCRHPAGPPRCWCRKPLPGLAVRLLREHGAAIERTRVLGSSPVDRTLASKLGVPLVWGTPPGHGPA